ncbi:MAG: glycerol-3-phosphate dehydrogenase [Gammaproteobacteria bacterium]|nr:glycerol-3-phosphate dehydrogenase [Gammaproteobacteria bacterium]
MDFDVIVIGGGINGAGIARDAALRGMRVCLLEQDDLCHATSRWCSRLIHGGLRYLEFGELGLVRESLHERETLLRTAPHLVHPLPLLIPLFAGARRGRLTVRAGMWLYDLLSAGKSLPRHRMLDAAGARAAMPGLAGDGLRGAARYHDAQVVFPERLVLENLLAAAQAGADIRLHARVERVLVADGRVGGVVVRDHQGSSDTVSAPLVVNAAGPWVDQLLETLDEPPRRHFIGGAKGTHIVVDRLPGLGDSACYAEAAADGRPFFIIPWNGMTLVGTTDIAFSGDPATVASDPAEIDYLLAEAGRLFPQADWSRQAVHYSYVGVRPLPAASGRDQAAITRRHSVRHHRREALGLYSVIGGKLTTYRSLAEEVVDRLARRLGRELARCSTAGSPLPGATHDPLPLAADLSLRCGLDPAIATRLVGLYGGRAAGIGELVMHERGLATPLGNSGAIAAELVFAFEAEMAGSLADCLMRRTMLGLAPDRGAGVLEDALAVCAASLGWDGARRAAERAGFLAEVAALQPPA